MVKRHPEMTAGPEQSLISNTALPIANRQKETCRAEDLKNRRMKVKANQLKQISFDLNG